MSTAKPLISNEGLHTKSNLIQLNMFSYYKSENGRDIAYIFNILISK